MRTVIRLFPCALYSKLPEDRCLNIIDTEGGVYNAEVDIAPDSQAKTLTIRLHPLANRSSDDAISHLCAELNATETLFPGTDLRLIYELVSAQSP